MTHHHRVLRNSYTPSHTSLTPPRQTHNRRDGATCLVPWYQPPSTATVFYSYGFSIGCVPALSSLSLFLILVRTRGTLYLRPPPKKSSFTHLLSKQNKKQRDPFLHLLLPPPPPPPLLLPPPSLRGTWHEPHPPYWDLAAFLRIHLRRSAHCVSIPSTDTRQSSRACFFAWPFSIASLDSPKFAHPGLEFVISRELHPLVSSPPTTRVPGLQYYGRFPLSF